MFGFFSFILYVMAVFLLFYIIFNVIKTKQFSIADGLATLGIVIAIIIAIKQQPTTTNQSTTSSLTPVNITSQAVTAVSFPTITNCNNELSTILIEAKTEWEQNKNKDKSIPLLKEIIHCDHEYLQAYIQLGRIYIQATDLLSTEQDKIEYLNEAIDILSQVIQIQPDYYEGYYNLALAYARKPGYINEAIENATKSIEIDPKQPAAWKNRGQYYLERSKQYTGLNKNNDVCRAIKDFTSALSLSPGYSSIYYYLGLAYTELGDFKRAKESYNNFFVYADKQSDVSEVQFLIPKVIKAVANLESYHDNTNFITCN